MTWLRTLTTLACSLALAACPPGGDSGTGGGAGGGSAGGGDVTGGGTAQGGGGAVGGGGGAVGGGGGGTTDGGADAGASDCQLACAAISTTPCAPRCAAECAALVNQTSAACGAQLRALFACALANPSANLLCSSERLSIQNCDAEFRAISACEQPDAGSPLPPVNFVLGQHNFSFENYANTNPAFTAVNLTPVEMVRLFGVGVCAGATTSGSCTLTPPAQNWMEAQNRDMNGGHCEGMAVLSLLFATGQADPRAFGADAGVDLQIASNVALQREIALWWATQSVDPTRSSDTRGKWTPTQVLNALQQSFADGGESYTFGLYKRNGSGGHANTPYGVREVDAGLFEVLVYENNFPGAVTGVIINTVDDSWSYSATPNPQTPTEVYDGDATTKSLTLTPTSARLRQQVCPVCGEVDNTGTAVRGNRVAYREIAIDGEANVSIADGQGRTIAADGGTYVVGIPGASIVGSRQAPSTWDDAEAPRFLVPLSTPLTVTVMDTGAPSTSGVRLMGPGFTFAVEDIALEVGQRDTITFGADMDRVRYVTSGPETPVVELGLTLNGSDYLFQVASAAETNGVTVELTAEVSTGRLALRISSQDGAAAYAVRVHALDDNDVVFGHAGVAITNAATVYLNYGAWQGEGTAMAFEFDDDSDGTVDRAVMVSDDL